MIESLASSAAPSTAVLPNGDGSQDGESGGKGALSQATSANLGKNDFLKLLTTQLQNQDPSNPMKGKDFAAQLAQFSSVEQLTNISGQIEEQGKSDGALAQSINDSMATDLIGRTVKTSGNTLQWTGEGEATFGVDLERPASEATVTIRDAGATRCGRKPSRTYRRARRSPGTARRTGAHRCPTARIRWRSAPRAGAGMPSRGPRDWRAPSTASRWRTGERPSGLAGRRCRWGVCRALRPSSPPPSPSPLSMGNSVSP